MNIHNPPGKRLQERFLQYPHVTCQCDQVNLRVLQLPNHVELKFRFEFCLEPARSKRVRCDSAVAGPVQDPGLCDIAQHQDDLAGNLPPGAGLGNCFEIRSTTRAEDADPQIRVRHAGCSKRRFPKTQALFGGDRLTAAGWQFPAFLPLGADQTGVCPGQRRGGFLLLRRGGS